MLRNFLTADVDLNGKSVLVTGGTGSFGQAFVRYLLGNHKLRRLVVFSRDEQKQFDMANSLPTSKHPELRYFIGDVRDRDRLELAMSGIDYVIHAAALKHVSIAEYNPFECIHTNVYGAENVVRAALRQNVKRVIALSTDKAANPINLYGSSKLASDKIFVAANHLAGKDGTRFAVVRYGNVFGSRGSVVPFFQRLIAGGATKLPITHPDMTRFWIGLGQGVEFVLSCLSMMRAGEIFVPKIPSMKVVDLARCLAPDLPHEIVGIRPGEKLHEVMITADDARLTVELDDRFAILPMINIDESMEYWSRHGSVAEAFEYSSDSNSEWLSPEAMNALLSAHVSQN
ncbi:UDP-N-acetylglucosamine 4,6-dehydratase (inverting) [Pseudorhodoplanes sp.]|uniref:UDP-N-acetylglucosamine 4,6-dehydratase (inverting) n=1 Tax=Pseudorhodoplanes sp. TaxID=1934341 RepID=UPI002B8A6D94|nr:UDP-N-acetylglucosamine 4,6-dehydratase (inverting) [Pseudorhodoplanes sp.]HWV54442.1 UDP-N-acetylglucosamine 4,6-dehydratase (inverting) [Pseudorhodoplanes sp.]